MLAVPRLARCLLQLPRRQPAVTEGGGAAMQLYKSCNISTMRIYHPDSEALAALRGSGIALVLDMGGVDAVRALAGSAVAAAAWATRRRSSWRPHLPHGRGHAPLRAGQARSRAGPPPAWMASVVRLDADGRNWRSLALDG
jgi:hypothetical protein